MLFPKLSGVGRKPVNIDEFFLIVELNLLLNNDSNNSIADNRPTTIEFDYLIVRLFL